MHRSKELLECMSEKFLMAAGEVKKDGTWEDMVLLAQMAEGLNEIYEACCIAKKLKSTEYDMDHHMHGGHETDYDYDGEESRGARRNRGAYSAEARRRHAMRDDYDYDYSGERGMTEEARRRRAMNGGTYSGRADWVDDTGRMHSANGQFTTNTNGRTTTTTNNGNLR